MAHSSGPDSRRRSLSETAFMVARPDGDWNLRWFTPTVEVDCCGHGTLAAGAVVLGQMDATLPEVSFHTTLGELRWLPIASNCFRWLPIASDGFRWLPIDLPLAFHWPSTDLPLVILGLPSQVRFQGNTPRSITFLARQRVMRHGAAYLLLHGSQVRLVEIA